MKISNILRWQRQIKIVLGVNLEEKKIGQYLLLCSSYRAYSYGYGGRGGGLCMAQKTNVWEDQQENPRRRKDLRTD
jgi:hypothetical protein